jgi:hemerythrin-like domain-containing protein
MSVASTSSFASPVTSAEFDVHVKDPVDHLYHCHERIERSLITIQNAVVGLRLAEPILRTEAAGALDYELATLQLLTRLHEEDEEKSLFPRLKAKVGNANKALNDLMAQSETQHRKNDQLFNQLAESIKVICAGPGTRADSAMDQLEKLVKELADLHGPHMNLEKEHIFTNLRQQLSADDLAAIQGEMKNRFEGKK